MSVTRKVPDRSESPGDGPDDRPANPRKRAAQEQDSERRSRRQQRAAAAAARARRERTRRLLLIGGGVLALLAVLAVVGTLIYRQVSGTVASEQAAAQNTGIAVPDEGREHVAIGTQITYKNYPPASGSHFPSAAEAGIYPNPQMPQYPGGLPEGFWVHNLEHGYITLLYKPGTDAETVRQIQGMMRDLPPSKYGRVKLVVTPYERMDTPITAVSWGYKLPLQTFDRDAILAFYKAHVDRGPEDLP